MPDVIVIGSLNIDLVARVPSLPQSGETLLASDATRYPGGKGANQAVAAAAAGARVRMVARVGSDQWGREYLDALTQRGVDVSLVQQDSSAPTGQAIVLVDDAGNNCIAVVQGANVNVSTGDLRALAPRRNDVILLQLEVPEAVVLAAAQMGRSAGCSVLLNLSPFRPVSRSLLDLCDIVIVNEIEETRLDAGVVPPDRLIVTKGAKGAEWGSLAAVPPRVKVLDTTGAGDAFAGVLAAGIASGASPEEALQNAVAAGAHAVTFKGAQGWHF